MAGNVRDGNCSCIAFFLILLLIPESPRWLVINNKTLKAEQVFSKLYSSIESGKQKVQEVMEQSGQIGVSNWKLLKNPGILKPVLLGMAIAILGQFMGVNAVLYYGPSIFEQSGLSGGDALFYQVMVGLVNVLTTILALIIIDRVGRKKLVYFGVSGMILSLILISFIFMAVIFMPYHRFSCWCCFWPISFLPPFLFLL